MKRRIHGFFKNISGLKKLLLCILLSLVVYVTLSLLKIDLNSRVILAWDTFCLCMILLSWILFLLQHRMNYALL